MKNLFYIIISLAAFCGCGEFYGEYAADSPEITEFVILNRSSVPISISICGADWISSEDTIYLKPTTGIWKSEKPRDPTLGQYLFNLSYSVMCVNFNNGEKILYFDNESDLPHNPCGRWMNEVWDEYKEHIVIEFSDEINKEIFEKYNEDNLLDMNLLYAPAAIDQNQYTLGSPEAYFLRTYPVPEIREKLKIGSVVYGEAESLDKIRFNEEYVFEPDSIVVWDYNSTFDRYHDDDPYSYYNLSTLRNLGQNHYGCDFAALSGRYGDDLERFSGMIRTKYYVGKMLSLWDLDHNGEHQRLLEYCDSPVYVVDNIIYGNVMFLLSESNCSPQNQNRYLEYHIREENYYYDQWYTPEILYHLITLDENGEFTCETGGEEVARKFIEGFSERALHPIYFTVTDFKESEKPLHIKGALN